MDQNPFFSGKPDKDVRGLAGEGDTLTDAPSQAVPARVDEGK